MTVLRRWTLLFPLLLVACGGEIEPGRTPAPAATISGLELLKVTAAPVAAAESFVGTVESEDRSLISARIDGRISHVAVSVGDEVKSGQVLLVIAGNSAGDRLAEAQGAQGAAAARLTLAEQTEARYRQLFAAEAVTAQEMDRVAAELTMARQGVAVAAAGVGQARTGVAQTQVTAPFAARVARREVELGSTVLPGMPLLVLDRVGGLNVRLDVPESRADALRRGVPLTVEVPASGRSYRGTVSEIEPASDPASRSLRVKVVLHETAGLAPGQFARGMVPGASRDALLVPATALALRGQLTGLYVVDSGVLRWRLVKTGRQVADRFEILAGLEAGETIVSKGVERAVSGARVGN